MLAGRGRGDRRAGRPGPADQPARRREAGGEDGLRVPHRGRGARAHRDVRPENRRPAGLLRRQAQAARAERADRLLPGRGAAVGRPGPGRRRRCHRRAEGRDRRHPHLAIRGSAPPWSRPSWPCTTWNATRSPPCAPRDPPGSLPVRDTHAAGRTVFEGHAENARNQREEPGPILSDRRAPCGNSG